MIEWAADARASAAAEPSANDVYLRAKAADSKQVWSVSVVRANGEEIGDEGRICISDYVTSTCRYKLASPPAPTPHSSLQSITRRCAPPSRSS